jgi:hypothetical protein
MNALWNPTSFAATMNSGIGYQRLTLALQVLERDHKAEETANLDEQVKLASKSLRSFLALVSCARKRRIESGFSRGQLEARSGLTVSEIRDIELLSLGTPLASYMVYFMALGFSLADIPTQDPKNQLLQQLTF